MRKELDALEIELLDFVGEKTAKGETLTRTINEFAMNKRITEENASYRWYSKNGGRVRKIFNLERGISGKNAPKRKKRTKKQLDYAVGLLKTHTYREVAELTSISTSVLNRHRIKLEELSSEKNSNKKSKSNGVKVSTVIAKLKEVDGNVCNKVDSMQNDLVKYIDNMGMTLSKDIKLLSNTIKIVNELKSSKPQTLKVTDQGYVNPKFQLDNSGEVKVLNKPIPISYDENKVNELIEENEKLLNENEGLVANLETLKEIEDKGINKIDKLEKRAAKLELDNVALEEGIAALTTDKNSLENSLLEAASLLKDERVESKTNLEAQEIKIKGLESQIVKLKEDNTELSSRGVFGRLFNVNSGGVGVS